MAIVAHASLADAMLDLHRQILARYGNIPDLLDDLKIQTIDCPDARGGPAGKVLAAYPKTGATDDNVLIAYFCVPAAQSTDHANAKDS